MARAQWRASTAHVEVVAKLLRTLKIGKQSPAHITIGARGLRVQTVSPSRVFNGQLFLESDLFATYEFTPGDENAERGRAAELAVTLSVGALVNCLQMFVEWSNHSDGPSERHAGCFFECVAGEKFQLSFAHDSMTSQCDLRLFAMEGTDTVREIAFNSGDVVLQVIMPAAGVLSLLRDVEAVAGTEMDFAVSVTPPQLEVRARGDLATADFVLPNEPGVLEALVAEQPVGFTFAYDNLAKCTDAVKLAKKVSLRFDSRGTLSVQCLCEFDSISAYIEFRVLANY